MKTLDLDVTDPGRLEEAMEAVAEGTPGYVTTADWGGAPHIQSAGWLVPAWRPDHHQRRHRGRAAPARPGARARRGVPGCLRAGRQGLVVADDDERAGLAAYADAAYLTRLFRGEQS